MANTKVPNEFLEDNLVVAGDLTVDTSTLVVDSTNNRVGIGTSSPTQGKVDILDNGAYSSHTGHGLAINSNSIDAYTSMYMGADDSIDSAYIQSAGKNTSFTSKKLLLNPNGGNVGIGTSSPNQDGFDANATVLSIKSANNGEGVLELIGGGNSSGDQISVINFMSQAVGNPAGQIKALRGSADDEASITFNTSGAERIRITSNGFTKHSNTGTYDTYAFADDSHQFVSNDASHSTLWVTNTNASYASTGMLRLESARAATSAFTFLAVTTGNLNDDQFLLKGDGNAYADGSWSGGGADYAEYFEWSDGNTDNEDRRGYTVVLSENKIRKSTSEDNPNNIIGVVSGNPSVIGNSDIGSWKNKYQKDDYGSYIKDENGYRVINDEYDETQDYVSRENRQEWDIIGLMGKVRINKGQPVNDRWIKMRDISDTVEEWYIR